ncbi:uncharacterized protein LOC117329873 [Pecten maximus]|uniref:uncharacterized protein LOC117329873 n=1 Tax=Pecten maximus TaxID=6579 RepID=UPI00145840A2|nr:uncharacterized protein LOC117329873 [Pecten maximus]
MSTKISKRVDSKSQKRLSVAPKCLAIVLSPDDVEPGKTPPDLSGKVVLDDFKLRNKTCYWNPALVESIQNLEYRGYVEPDTLLVGGEDIHLENLRTAWGRRVLNDPAHFRITRIGDIGSIKMQVIPQTQFIPLPEILCLVILDLNSKQVVATLDVIHTRLTQCFCDLQSPGVQVLYDTLGTLIRQRKVFHNGSGYFVVTPDTYRLPTDDPQQSYPVSWMHYNPMYIPVPTNQQKTLLTRSISCQVSLVNQPQTVPQAPPTQTPPSQVIPATPTEVSKPREEIYTDGTDILQSIANEKPRLSRSSSARHTKERASKDERDNTKSVSRCSSMRGERGCRGGENRDLNLANSNLNKVKDKGEKKSLLSKLFGRKKKKKPEKQQKQLEERKVEPPAAITVSSGEYATFSAQFPPPEWQWYQEQIEKQERTNSWLYQQKHPGHEGPNSKQDGSSSSDYVSPQQLFPRQHVYEAARRQKMMNPSKLSPFAEHDEEHYCQIDPRFEESLRNLRASTLPPEGYYDGNCMNKKSEFNPGCQKHSSKAATLPVQIPQNTEENHHIHRRHSESHGHRRRHEVGNQARVRRHSGERKQLLVQADQCYSNSQESGETVPPNQPSFPYHTQHKHIDHGISDPLYSSTPRGLQKDPGDTVHNNTVDELFNEKLQERSHRGKKSSKSSRHRHRHSIADHSSYPKNDISYEYHGKLPKKSSIKALSRDSGVNCIGLGQRQSKVKGHNKDRCSTPIELISKRSHSEGRKQSSNPKQNNIDVGHTDKKHSNINNEVVCVAEINSCVPPEAREMTPTAEVTPPDEYVPYSVQEEDEGMDGDVDSFIEESEQSYDTVIDSRTRNSKRISDLCDQARNINLGDSGFSSPGNHDSLKQNNYRITESVKCEEVSYQSSSSGGKNPKLSHMLQDSVKRPCKDHSLYERSDLIVLNNMKDVHRDQNLLSNHVMNQMPLYQSNHTSLATEAIRLADKSPVPFNFQFDGDYQVVGVV